MTESRRSYDLPGHGFHSSPWQSSLESHPFRPPRLNNNTPSGDRAALAKLLQAGRLVIEQNQTLIDDPHKGTRLAEVFERQMYEFSPTDGDRPERADNGNGVGHTASRAYAPARLIDAGKEVRDAGRHQSAGIGYKFIPATFSVNGDTLLQTVSGQTETTAINRAIPERARRIRGLRPPLAVGAVNSDTYVSELTESGRTLRVAMPIYYQRACRLPRRTGGEWDISGYRKAEGDLAGPSA